MIGVDDLMEDTHWINVQDPIRQMFLSISKAIRVQAAGIRDLDTKCSHYVTHDLVQRMMKESFDQACSKQDATQIIYQIESKAPAKDLYVVETTVQQLSHQIQKMQDQLLAQNTIIHDLTSKVQYLSDDLTHVKQSPNYQPIFEYIDRQVQHIVNDVDRKLQSKVEKHDMESMLPHRVEEIYQSLYQKQLDLTLEVKSMVKKEEFISVMQQKAEKQEIKDLQQELTARITRPEVHQLVHNQVKPLYTSFTTFERNFGLQEQMAKQLSADVQDKLSVMTKQYTEIQNCGLIQLVTHHTPHYFLHLSDNIRQIVLDVMKEKKVGEFTQLTMDTSLANHTEYVLKQVAMVNESNRLEVLTSTREELNLWKHPMQQKVDAQEVAVKEIQEKSITKIRKAMKELSHNIVKALSKKVDLKDFKHYIKEAQLTHSALTTLTATTAASTTGGGDAPATFLGSASKQATRELHRANERILAASTENTHEVNSEFAHLMHSMRSGKSVLHPTTTTTSDSLTGSPTTEEDEYIYGHGEYGEYGEYAGQPSTGATGSSTSMFASPIASSRSAHRHHRSASSSRSPATIHRGTRSILKQSQSKQSNTNTTYQQQSMLVMERLSAQILSTKTQIEDLRNEMNGLKEQYYSAMRRTAAGLGGSSTTHPTSPTRGTGNTGTFLVHTAQSDLNTLDWRIALGELGMNVRREIADKASREELYSVLRHENDALISRILSIEKQGEAYALAKEVTRMDNEFLSLKQKVSGELTGARFLWTSGILVQDGWVPWDIQVINAAPQIIQWKKNTTKIVIRIPGLYRLCLSLFTLEAAIIQIYLNDEPIFSYQPDSVTDNTGVAATASHPPPHPNSHMMSQFLSAANGAKKNDSYYLKRLRHSAGEVSSLTIDEHVSLPPDATLSIKYYSSIPAQGFFSIRKL